jgi:cell division initiation protein
MFKSDDQMQAVEPRRLPSPDRNPTVSPLDLRQSKFSTTLRGFDRAEVTAFLLEAADGYEQALRENDRLRQEVMRLETSLHQHRELEGSLKSTLVSAQKVADDLRETAAQEAARIVREAEGRAELVLQTAQARQEDVQREIDALRLKRREAEANLESIIAALHNTIEFIHEQEQREHRVVAHRPRLDVAAVK